MDRSKLDRYGTSIWFTSKAIGFTQSTVDECVFYRGCSLYVLYTDNSILPGPDESKLDRIIKDMKKAGLKLTVEGNSSDFLGVQIERKPDDTIHLTQPHLIDQILQDLRLLTDLMLLPRVHQQKLESHYTDTPSLNPLMAISTIGQSLARLTTLRSQHDQT